MGVSTGGILAEEPLTCVDVEPLQEFSSHLFGRGEHVRLEPSEKGVVERIKARILQRGGAWTTLEKATLSSQLRNLDHTEGDLRGC
jgi:hypothetical protein